MLENQNPLGFIRVPSAAPQVMSTGASLTDQTPRHPAFEDLIAGDSFEYAYELSLGGRPELMVLWKKILENFEDQDLHDAFVAACARDAALPFAAYKYGRILKVIPNQPLAKTMAGKIEAHAALATFDRSQVEPPLFRTPVLDSVVLVLASAVVVMGLLLPEGLGSLSQAMIAIGLAAGLLVFGLRITARSSRS